MNCPLRKCGRYGEVAVRVQFDCITFCHASMITLITKPAMHGKSMANQSLFTN